MKYLLYAAACAALAACGDRAPTDPADGTLTTDSTSYTAIPIGYNQVVVKVVTTFRNTTSAPIELPRCFPTTPYPEYGVTLESPSDPDGAAYNPNWACVGHNNPIVVPPMSARVDTLRLNGPNGYDNTKQRYIGALSGRFRISYGGKQSNAFTIQLPPSGAFATPLRDLSAPLQTDSLLVHMTTSGQFVNGRWIKVTYFNPTSDTLTIINCNGASFGLEKLENGNWVNAWISAVGACFSTPIVIPPQGHVELAANFSGGRHGFNGAPQFSVDYIPGIYRLVLDNLRKGYKGSMLQDWGTVVPIELRRSNPFALVIDP